MSDKVQSFNDRLVSLVSARADAAAGLAGVSESALVGLLTGPDPDKAIQERVEKLQKSLRTMAKVRAELVEIMADKVGRGAVVALYTPKGEPAINPLNGINSWSVRDILAQMTPNSKGLKLTSIRKG
jgi:hypothetical protein